MTESLPSPRNRLLAALPDADRACLAPHLELVTLSPRQKLAVAQRPIDRIFFPESGLVSAMSAVRGELPVEIGVVGREGVVNLPALLDAERSPVDCLVQVGGLAFALDAERGRALAAENPALNALVRRYAQALMMQGASTVIATARASLGQRLARWLLMARDRLDDDSMPLTHEFLSMMLAVRRPSITLALSEFESAGWIERRRGCIVLLDRDALLAEADGFYGMAEQEIERALSGEDGGLP